VKQHFALTKAMLGKLATHKDIMTALSKEYKKSKGGKTLITDDTVDT